MNILKRILAGLLVVYLAFGQVTVIPGDWVQGFSSLTTAGSNVYVTGVGTIGQDTSFTRSAAGRYTLYDATPTTGVTTLTVRAGAGQSTTNTISILDNAGVSRATFDNIGQFSWLQSDGTTKSTMLGDVVRVGSAKGYFFSNSSGADGTLDLGLVRDGASRLRVSNGSTGLGQIMIASSTPASAAAACSAGTIVWDTGFVYVCTATNTWKRAAIATW